MAELFDSLAGRIGPVLCTFVQYLIEVCNRMETACGVISCKFLGLIVRVSAQKFRDPRLNRSGEIAPEAVGSGIFDCYFERR